jgi:hypothetical protein
MVFRPALLLALLAQSAGGAVPGNPPATARLDVRDGGECVSRADLVARVAARSSRIQFVDNTDISAQVAVTSARPGNVAAELVLVADGAEPTPRRVVARSCAEAADAIALIIAVTLDPTLKTNGGALDAAKPPDQPPPPPPPQPPKIETPATPAASPSSRPFAAYLAGQTIFGPAPNVMPSVAIFAMAALDREGLWSPALFVGATHAWRTSLAEPGGSASFTLDAASVDACPLRLAWHLLAVRPCAAALVGRLASSGADTGAAASTARPFASAGAAVSAGVGIGGRLELSLRLGVGLTLIRDSYEFGSATFHRADSVTTSASLGIGARWP